MQETSIEWATATWNPTRGCSRVSPGCGGPNGVGGCYAEKVAVRFSGPGLAYEGLTTRGRWNGVMKLVEKKIDDPLRWKTPERIFVNSMSDLFHENLTNHEIARVFATMARAHWHTFLVLTKRHERLPRFFAEQEPPIGFAWPLPNVWLGVSVENQEYADRRIPELLQAPATVRFLSIEPLLGPVNLKRVGTLQTLASAMPREVARIRDQARPHTASGMQIDTLSEVRTIYHQTPDHMGGFTCTPGKPRIDWVIVGGESGPGARPCNVAWIRSIAQQCRAAAVPVFVKQLGANVRDRNDAGFDGDDETSWPDDPRMSRIKHLVPEGNEMQGDLVRVHLRDRKGGNMHEWPPDIRVREFPTTTRDDEENTSIAVTPSVPSTDGSRSSYQVRTESPAIDGEAAANDGVAATSEVVHA